MICGRAIEAGADAQAIQRLECRPIADDRCRYGGRGMGRSEDEGRRNANRRHTGGVANPVAQIITVCACRASVCEDIGQPFPKRAGSDFGRRAFALSARAGRSIWSVSLRALCAEANVGSAD